MRTAFGSTHALIRAIFTTCLSLMMIVAFQISLAGDADAKKRKRYTKSRVAKKSRPNPRYAAYVIDAKTGKVLFSRNGNARRYPASLTKMMTLYLVFEDLKSGRIKLNDRLVMSKAGWRREPSKLGLKPGQSISMNQAIYSLVTKSANDVATALGDQLAGSEAAFARRMTRKARQLGMKKTTFKNANGLTARGQTTTASDMAKLGLALREHFPRRYKYFKTRVFKYGKRRYKNHNRLLGKVRGVDGIKTGYTRASGFNLVTSASAGGRRIVAVVMGGRSGKSRNAHMTKLVRQYLPKASRGKARVLVARARSSRPGVAIKKDVDAVSSSLRKMAASATPVPVLRDQPAAKAAAAAATAATPAAVAPKKAAEPVLHVNSIPAPRVVQKKQSTGWQIQLTASDDRKKALSMLERAKAKNKRLLAFASPVTLEIVKNGTRLYRARFIGFQSKASARQACRVLKKQRYSCLALSG